METPRIRSHQISASTVSHFVSMQEGHLKVESETVPETLSGPESENPYSKMIEKTSSGNQTWQ